MVRTEWNTVEEKDKTAAGIQVVQIQMAGETFTNKLSRIVKMGIDLVGESLKW